MIKSKIVTGYVRLDLPASHRTDDDYKQLSPRLLHVPVPKTVFDHWPVENCWLHNYLRRRGQIVSHSTEDNPNKNTLKYLIVLAQKTEWLRLAMEQDYNTDVFVWMDYGIFHQMGHSEGAIVDLMGRVSDKQIAIPGIYPHGPINDYVACWRFCGSMMVVPRNQIPVLDGAIKSEYMRNIEAESNVTWDVNIWAHVEDRFPGLIQWYAAGHNGSMVTNYKV